MSRNNTIGIVGEITAPPELIVDAADWARKVYEVELTRTRPSGTEDTYILQYDGRAAGSKEMLERITEGAEIFCGGEIRSENVHDPKPEENRVKVFISRNDSRERSTRRGSKRSDDLREYLQAAQRTGNKKAHTKGTARNSDKACGGGKYAHGRVLCPVRMLE